MKDETTSTAPEHSIVLPRVVLAVVGFAFWLLVAWPLSSEGRVVWSDVAIGLAVAVFAALVMREIVGERFARLLSPRRYAWAAWYVPVFAWHVIRGNLDVAYRVLHPAMPIRPGIVAASTRLRSPAARTLLANSITLTPGTLTVDIVDDVFFIHCIHVDGAGEEAFARTILERFEAIVAGILE